jgi:hypothetical protein
MLSRELPSIHNLVPLEQGGPTARAGFLYQDHVAARFRKEQVVDFEKAGERLSDGFNKYLNTIREQDSSSWTKTGDVTAWISERRTQLQIGGRTARKQLGGTLTIYFLFAYHYTLLNLSRYQDCHYPGVSDPGFLS